MSTEQESVEFKEVLPSAGGASSPPTPAESDMLALSKVITLEPLDAYVKELVLLDEQGLRREEERISRFKRILKLRQEYLEARSELETDNTSFNQAPKVSEDNVVDLRMPAFDPASHATLAEFLPSFLAYHDKMKTPNNERKLYLIDVWITLGGETMFLRNWRDPVYSYELVLRRAEESNDTWSVSPHTIDDDNEYFDYIKRERFSRTQVKEFIQCSLDLCHRCFMKQSLTIFSAMKAFLCQFPHRFNDLKEILMRHSTELVKDLKLDTSNWLSCLSCKEQFTIFRSILSEVPNIDQFDRPTQSELDICHRYGMSLPQYLIQSQPTLKGPTTPLVT